MAIVTITVAAAQVGAVRAALLTLYQLEADALAHACEAHLGMRDPIAAVHARRAALAEVEALVEEIGWDQRAIESESMSLTGRAEILTDAVYAALLGLVDQLEILTRELWKGAVAPAEVRAAAHDLHAFLDLFGDLRGR